MVYPYDLPDDELALLYLVELLLEFSELVKLLLLVYEPIKK